MIMSGNWKKKLDFGAFHVEMCVFESARRRIGELYSK